MEINVVNSNEFKSTKDSREKLMIKLSLKEQKMFKDFWVYYINFHLTSPYLLI